MKLNCKVGDLAVIINDDDDPRNIGTFVRVVRPTSSDPIHDGLPFPKEFYWLIKPSAPIASMIYNPEKNDWSGGWEYSDCETNIADKDLKPIRGLPKKTKSVKEKKEDVA